MGGPFRQQYGWPVSALEEPDQHSCSEQRSIQPGTKIVSRSPNDAFQQAFLRVARPRQACLLAPDVPTPVFSP
jgi:hypothetical protein